MDTELRADDSSSLTNSSTSDSRPSPAGEAPASALMENITPPSSAANNNPSASATASSSRRRFWFRGRSSTDQTPAVQISPLSTPGEAAVSLEELEQEQRHLKETYEKMLKMTLELFDDIYLNLRPGDSVLSAYGSGVLLEREASEESSNDSAVPIFLSSSSSTAKAKIKLDWGGVLHCPQSDHVHKKLSLKEYETGMDHLEEIRKLQVALQCQEWGIKPPQSQEACVACLFQKPELYSKTRRTYRGTSYWRSNTSASRNGSISSTEGKSTNAKAIRCDVCGNPVCAQHKIRMGADVEFFILCVDCSHDLHHSHHNIHAHHPQLLSNLQRLVQYYMRMSVQLCFCVPNLGELQTQLTSKQRRDGAISLGNSALGFVGAALGVAGAAAMLTPAGPAILVAAVATSATSGTFQGMHASYNMFISNKTARELADRCLGWHGLCLGILNALEELRQDLIHQELDLIESPRHSQLTSARVTQGQHSLDIWNALAVGSFKTTRSAMTGVGVTSAMGASYSQAINTSLQGIPVVGAAFSVGCMAMDANNMASSFKLLNTPAKKAVALQGVEQSFAKHVVTTIAPQVAMIVQATDDLRQRLAEQQLAEERARIDQELQGLGGKSWDEEDEDIERELQGL